MKIWYWKKHYGNHNAQVNLHLRWTMKLIIMSGVLLILIPLITVMVLGLADSVILFLLVYIVIAHACCVFPGIYGLSKAMALDNP